MRRDSSPTGRTVAKGNIRGSDSELSHDRDASTGQPADAGRVGRHIEEVLAGTAIDASALLVRGAFGFVVGTSSFFRKGDVEGEEDPGTAPGTGGNPSGAD